MTDFPDLKLTMDHLTLQSDRAVFYRTFAGTSTGPGGARQRVLFSECESWQIGDDGLIAESRGHFDEASFQHRLKHGLG